MADPDDVSTRALGRPQDDSAPSARPAKAAPSSGGQPAAAPDFGPRYRVLGMLGKGGMGEVYHAYDTELRGEVALKIVRGDADHDEALARFRREIALARRVTSPHVLRVYDLAEHAGLRFLSMEYVDGENLGTIMRRDGRIPLPRALALFHQVCTGLAAAHAEGVIHRDLKPQNVLVDRTDRVRVGDFGIALSMGESAFTLTGAVLGSPAYMSPEQVKGDPVDARSDLYSLGILLYQLLAGEPPFRADTPHAVMEMRLHKPPPPLRATCPDVPAYLEAIIARCLAIDPGERYASVRDLIADLDAGRAPRPARRRRPRWLVAALGAAAIAAGAIAVVHAWGHREPVAVTAAAARPEPAASSAAPPPPSGPVTVLVVGIQNHTTDPVFDGTLDVVFDYALRRSEHVDPIAGAELRALASELGPDVSFDAQLGKQLAARDHDRVVVVTGAVAPAGAGVAISVTAIDAATGARVFAQTRDVASYDQVVPATGGLASGLRAALGDRVAEADRERTGVSPQLEADHELSVGMASHFTGNNAEAAAHLERALAVDPAFAVAHSDLAKVYWNLNRTPEANQQLELAMRYLEELGERDRLNLLGLYYTNSAEDYGRAVATYQKVLLEWPKDVAAENNIAVAYALQHDTVHALASAARAAHDHPRDVILRADLVSYEVSAGQLDRAVTDGNRVLADFPHAPATAYRLLGIAHALLGQHADALDAYGRLAQRDPARGLAAQADLAFAEGRLADAARLVDQALSGDAAHRTSRDTAYLHVMRAELHLRRGDKAGARAEAALVTEDSRCLVAAALVQLAAGDDRRAMATATSLAEDVAPTRRALGKLVEGEALRLHGKPKQAMVVIRTALGVSDLPLAHLLLARAALDARSFHEALGELESCIGSSGEIANHSFVGEPAVRYVPLLTYDLARAEQGLGSPDAKASYDKFLAMLHDPDPGDPIVEDARRRARGP